MRDDERTDGSGESPPDPSGPMAAPEQNPDETIASSEAPPSLTDELAGLIDDGRTYAEAELAFQKTRAKLAGRKVGASALFAIVAILLLHVTVIALIVGLMLALEPMVGIWASIGIVIGGLLLLVVILALLAKSSATGVSSLFKDTDS